MTQITPDKLEIAVQALRQIAVIAEFNTSGPGTVPPCKSDSLNAMQATSLRGSIAMLARDALHLLEDLAAVQERRDRRSADKLPQDMVLVPRVPTAEMERVGGHVNSEWLNDYAPIGEPRYAMPIKSIWSSMLAAAPNKPTDHKSLLDLFALMAGDDTKDELVLRLKPDHNDEGDWQAGFYSVSGTRTPGTNRVFMPLFDPDKGDLSLSHVGATAKEALDNLEGLCNTFKAWNDYGN